MDEVEKETGVRHFNSRSKIHFEKFYEFMTSFLTDKNSLNDIRESKKKK